MKTANIGKSKSSEALSPPVEDQEVTTSSEEVQSPREEQEVTTPTSSEENHQTSDATTNNEPLNIREIFSLGEEVRIKEDHDEFGGQSGTITFIPNIHCAVVEFSPGFRKVIQLEDFELPPQPPLNDDSALPEQSQDSSARDSLAEGSRVKIKQNHYFGGQEGIITSFPNRNSVLVQFSPGNRELIPLKDLDLSQKPQPKRPKKKEIIIQEGLNYKAGYPGYGCKWYIEVAEQTYQGLKEYREKVGTITIDAALIRFLDSQNHPQPISSEDLCRGLTSNLKQLTDDRVRFILEAISKTHYDAFVQVFNAIKH